MKLFAVAIAALTFIAAVLTPAVAVAQTASPGFVYAEAVRGHVVVINWEPTTTGGTIDYYIYRGTGATEPSWPGGYSKIATVSGQTMQSYVDEDPKATSTRYWYVVTAKSSTDTESNPSPTGNGLTSRYQPVSTSNMYRYYIGPTTGPPVEPKGLELSGADSTITIDWDAVPSTNVDHYNIYRSEQSGVEGTLVAQVSAPTTIYDDGGVEKYKHYYYRVSAVDDQSNEGYKSIEHMYRTVSSADIDAPHGGSAVATLTPGQDTCGMCHKVHVADAPKLLLADDELGEPALCLSCHDGTGSRYDVRREFTDTSNSSHEVTITAGDGSTVVAGMFDCVDCHTPHGDPDAVGSKKLLYANGATEGNDVCYGSECHGSSSSTHWAGDMQAFEDSVHNSEVPDPPSGTKVICSTCHMPHASPNESLNVMTSYRNCLDCHSSEHVEMDTPDIYTRLTMNQDHESHHDVLERDQVANGTYMSCQNCHNTHIVSAEYPLVDPDDPSLDGQWTESRTTSLAISNGSATAPKYNGFCLTCHDGSLPTSVDTSPWAEAPDDNGLLVENILDRWTNNNAHGALSAGGTPILNPASGYAYQDTLSCLTCHESHGTINNSNLRCDVPAKDGTTLATARLLVPRLDSSGNETGSYDTRFFCMSCHLRQANNPPNHSATNQNQPKTFYYFPTTCSDRACHTHGTTSARRF
jgi:predicted CXXCH cytochrome family protein